MKFTTLLFFTVASISLFVGAGCSEPAEFKVDETMVKDVVTFFQNNEFGYELEGSSRNVYGTKVIVTDNEQSKEYSFSYDASSAILKIACRKKYNNTTGNTVSASLTVSIYEVQCSTFGPSFTIGKFDEFILAEVDNVDDFRTISFKAQRRDKSIRKTWETGTADFPRWDEMEKQLEKKEFEDSFEEVKVKISLDKDMAPRLKGALEDLARAHGTSISKY